MTFNPSHGVPNPFNNPAKHTENVIPDPPNNADGSHKATSPLSSGLWEPPLFNMTKPASTDWDDLYRLPTQGPKTWQRWRRIYDPQEGMTKGELAARYLSAKKTLQSVEFILSTWSTTNNVQGGIKGMALGLISSVLSSYRHFSPSELRSSMAGMINSLPEPFCSVLSSVFSGSTPADKASRFISAIRQIQRWQPDEGTAEHRLKIALKNVSTARIRSFLNSHPLVLPSRVLRITEELAHDTTEPNDIRHQAFKLLRSYGYAIDEDILNALGKTMGNAGNASATPRKSPWGQFLKRFKTT